MSEHSKHVTKQAHQRHEEKVAQNKPQTDVHHGNEEIQDIEFVEHIVPDTQAWYEKLEHFFDANKKYVYYGLLAIVAPILLYIAYKKFYVAPMEDKAQVAIFRAQQLFEKGDFEKALKGDPATKAKGFENIINNFGPTKAANLSHLYAGICNLKLKKFDAAIDHLEDFKSSDGFLNTMAKGALGDAYSEKKDMDKAISYYKEAAHDNKNSMTTPLNLFKAALATELKGNKEEALELYYEIRNDYPKSAVANQLDKYIVRAGGTL